MSLVCLKGPPLVVSLGLAYHESSTQFRRSRSAPSRWLSAFAAPAESEFAPRRARRPAIGRSFSSSTRCSRAWTTRWRGTGRRCSPAGANATGLGSGLSEPWPPTTEMRASDRQELERRPATAIAIELDRSEKQLGTITSDDNVNEASRIIDGRYERAELLARWRCSDEGSSRTAASPLTMVRAPAALRSASSSSLRVPRAGSTSSRSGR